MKERPILFSAPMVLAILDGSKTQTRRLVTVPWHKGKRCLPYDPYYTESAGKLLCQDGDGNYFPITEIASPPYGVPGDRLWVRETHFLYGRWESWKEAGNAGDEDYFWKFVPQPEKGARFPDSQWPAPTGIATTRHEIGWFKRPSIFMPRWASRITLEVMDVRVQRLLEINEEDAVAEGIESAGETLLGKTPLWKLYGKIASSAALNPTSSFASLWNSINAQRAPWLSNPWVWAITFKRILP